MNINDSDEIVIRPEPRVGLLPEPELITPDNVHKYRNELGDSFQDKNDKEQENSFEDPKVDSLEKEINRIRIIKKFLKMSHFLFFMCIYHSCQGKVQYGRKSYDEHEVFKQGADIIRRWSAFFIDLVENIRK